MIKCNVTVCGTVSKAATCRTNKEGKAFVSFAMNVVIPAKSGINKTIEVSVIKDGTLTEVGSCNIGNLIEGSRLHFARNNPVCADSFHHSFLSNAYFLFLLYIKVTG